MASKVNMSKILVVWEDEIRIAAKALKRFRDVVDADSTGEVLANAMMDAVKACDAAIQGCEDDTVSIMISRLPQIGKVKREDKKEKDE